VVERSERYASGAKPEEHKDTNDERVPRLLAAVQNALQNLQRAERPEGEARTFIQLKLLLFIYSVTSISFSTIFSLSK
jgi:hypothetical protein